MPELHIPEDAEEKSSGPVKAPTPDGGISFKRSALFNEISAGIQFKKGKEKSDLENQRLVVDERTVTEYSTLLDYYTRRLKDVNDADSTILRDPQFALERQMYEIFKDSLNSGNQTDTKLEAAIAAFLRSPDGFSLANQALGKLAMDMASAIGDYEKSNSPGGRSGNLESETTRTGEERGKVNRVVQDVVAPLITVKNGVISSVIAGSAAAGLMMGELAASDSSLAAQLASSGVGAAAGVAAAVGAMSAGSSLSKEGRVYQTTQTLDALKYMQDPIRSKYFKALLGFNPTNLDATTGQLKPDSKNPKGPDKIRKDMRQILTAREHYYKNLGIPKKQLDRMPEEFLLSYDSKGRPEETNIIVNQKIWDEFESAGGYVAGNVANNLKRYNEARAKVMVKVAKEYIASQKEDTITKKQAALKSELDKKVTAREGESNEEFIKRTRESTEKQNKLTEDKAEIERKQNTFTALDDKENELEENLKVLAEKFMLTPTSNSLSDISASISSEISRIDSILRSAPGTLTGLENQLEDFRQKIRSEGPAAINAAKLVARSGLGPKDQISKETVKQIEDDAYAEVEGKYRFDIKDLEKQINELVTRKTELSDLSTIFREKTGEIIHERRTVLVEAPKELVVMRAANERIITTPGATISAVELEFDDVDTLMEKIKNPPYSIPAGTDEEKKVARQFIIQAKTEQIASQIELTNPSPTDQLTAFNEIAFNPGLPITPDDLLRKPDSELASILSTHVAYGALRTRLSSPSSDIRTELGKAKEEAQKRVILRYKKMLEVEKDDTDSQLEKVAESIKGVDLTLERDELREVSGLIDRYGTIMEVSQNIASDEGMPQYVDTTSILANDPTYTEEEKKMRGKVKGYYELLDGLFDYKNNANRGERFLIINKLLPPKKMAQLLVRGMGLAVYPGDEGKIDKVLDEMKTELEKGTKDARDVREAMKLIVDQLGKEATVL